MKWNHAFALIVLAVGITACSKPKQVKPESDTARDDDRQRCADERTRHRGECRRNGRVARRSSRRWQR